jgi:hypothetical protein
MFDMLLKDGLDDEDVWGISIYYKNHFSSGEIFAY